MESHDTSQAEAVVRFHLWLSYDGSGYHGWARQRELPSVQATVEAALQVVLATPEPVLTVCAGRTDAGVHARDQHVHADAPSTAADIIGKLPLRLNGILPLDVRIHGAEVVPASFDARFAALSREYSYRVVPAQQLDPLRRGWLVPWGRALDLDLLNEAAEQLLGLHDFAAFCRRRPDATTIRTLQECRWQQHPDGVVELRIKADAFCHSMVRSIVGAMLTVGDGRRSVQWLASLLAHSSRNSSVHVAPPYGLVLEHVAYPDESQWLQRIEKTKAKRVAVEPTQTAGS